MDRPNIFYMARIHGTDEDLESAADRDCMIDSDDNPPLIVENKNSHFEAVTYMQDDVDMAEEVT